MSASREYSRRLGSGPGETMSDCIWLRSVLEGEAAQIMSAWCPTFSRGGPALLQEIQ